MERYRISGLPITTEGKLVGILTNRDLRFETNFEQSIENVMTKDRLVTVPVGTTLEQAKEILHKNRIEKLLVVDKHNNLRGLITIKDILKIKKYPIACKDGEGRVRARGARGDARDVVGVVRAIRNNFREVQLIAGNVATGEGAEAIIKAGADCVKAGVGPGSICTTRVIAGVGVPQLSAIMKCAAVAPKRNIPLIAARGVKDSGAFTREVAAGGSGGAGGG